MIKYLIVIVFELIIGFYWLMYNYLYFLKGVPLILYLFIFPIIYFLFILIDIFKYKKIFYYFLSLIPLVGLITFSFVRDGLTTYKNNPDSSLFGWFFGFSIIRFILFLICLFIVLIIYYFKKKGKNKK